MTPCNGKRCEKCELSPAYNEGFQEGIKKANERLNPLMKEITECVINEAHDNGYEECKTRMAAGEWKTCQDELPPDDGNCVLAIVDGKLNNNIEIRNGVLLACYSKEHGWILDDYPSALDFKIKYWATINMPIE